MCAKSAILNGVTQLLKVRGSGRKANKNTRTYAFPSLQPSPRPLSTFMKTAPVTQRSWVPIPFRPEFFSGFNFKACEMFIAAMITDFYISFSAVQIFDLSINYNIKHKNYNFLDCDWFKKTPIFHYFTCQVVIGQFAIGQFAIGQFVIVHFVIGQFNKPITFKVVV